MATNLIMQKKNCEKRFLDRVINLIPDPILLSPEPFPLSPDPSHILGFEP